MSFVEEYRERCVNAVFSMAGFSKCWPVWRAEIDKLTHGMTSADAIYDLGSNLKAIFKLTGTTGRKQGDLSGGGASWEGLVCWYLNTVLTDTRAVVSKKSKALAPTAVLDAISVNYNNIPTNTESDLLGLSFPSDGTLPSGAFTKQILDDFAASHLGEFDVHNLQCKTNWNDNAQIPMLWDMIYRAKGFKDAGVSIGRNGRTLSDLNLFTYSFVTVPSQSKPFKPGGMPAKRVSGLSGGNFWGQSSMPGVAWSVSEIFKKVFGDDVIGDVRKHISSCIQSGSIKLR